LYVQLISTKTISCTNSKNAKHSKAIVIEDTDYAFALVVLADKETFEQIKFQNKFLFSGGKATGLSGKNKKEFRDSTMYKLSDQIQT
jgi:hypothetical protein